MSSPLYSLIAREAAQRPLTIARYMEWALQHPEYGYYRQHDPLGLAGDFVTAPEISQMFGELIGLWCVDCWWQMGQPAEFVLLELGPGRGTLMADALRAARKTPAFMQAVRLHLLESNEVLRQQQSERLTAYAPVWVTSLSEVPAVPTLIIANEFFDALPIRQE
jgi:NADH dehydrogenase [ubiquinone] 1 alpha subcomplex assembly factor 7